MHAPHARFLLAAVLASSLVPGVPLAAQGRSDREEMRARLDTTVTLTRGGTVDLTQLSGDITVTSTTGDRVRVRAWAERGDLRFDASGSRVTLEVETVRGRIGDSAFEVAVPAGTRVIAKSHAGDISISGTRGVVEAESTSGDVSVEGAAERIALESVSGDITGSDLRGDVRAESVSGSVELRGVTGAVTIETTNGDIVLEQATSRSVTIETVNGEMEFDGALDAQGRYEFHAHSGDVRLHLPEVPNARFDVQTWSGDFESEFPVTLQPGARQGQRPQRFEFTSGAGAARVTVETFSGDIFLEKRVSTTR